ncbi:MAG: superoxide dismutase [Kiritimatiellae bacterium]|jgi:muconolactone delta-isomerase|nr:superoxide dismutase [Kiritimatiellia bacterium]
MKFLALEREVAGVTEARYAPHLAAEAARAWELYQQGVIRELYFRSDRDEAVLVLECPDTHSAQAALSTLPLVRHGLIAFELIPLTPYPGFARLFTASGGAGAE